MLSALGTHARKVDHRVGPHNLLIRELRAAGQITCSLDGADLVRTRQVTEIEVYEGIIRNRRLGFGSVP